MNSTTQRSVGPLPLEIQDISAEFLTTALSTSFPGVAIKQFQVDEVHHGFSTILRLHLEADKSSRAADLPKTIMLKGGFEAATRKRGRNYTVLSFEMEFNSYRILKPTLGLHMPECYFKEFDQERAQMIILMEDLAARGVRFGRGLKPYSPDQVRRVLSSLAELHSKTWDSPELKAGGLYSAFPSNGAAMFADYLEHAGYDLAEWERYVAKPRGMACSVKFHDYDWLLRALHLAAKLSDESPNCVVHGDTHLGNLYEEIDGTPGFLDSLARRESGVMEATYHICNAMDPMDRKHYDRELMAHYRDELVRHGVKAPSLDEMMYQFAVFAVVNYVTFIVNEPTYQTEAFNTAHASRANSLMLDHNTYDLVNEASQKVH